MGKRGISLFIVVLLSIFMMSLVSAGVFFNQQPGDSYNLGDKVKFIVGSDGAEGWLGVYLNCNDNSTTNKLISYNYLSEEQTSIPINVPLSNELLRGSIGECFFSLDFNGLKKDSLSFSVSSELDVIFEMEKEEFNPNETVYFSGSVTKKSGRELKNAFAEIKFPYKEISFITPIIGGEFEGNISLDSDIPSGSYSLDVFVFEKNNDEVTNFHLLNYSIHVVSVPKSLEVVVNGEVKPDSDLEFVVKMYDQANEEVDGLSTAITMINSKEEKVLSILSETGTSEYYKLRKNAPVGYWNISAESEGLFSKVKRFYVKENMEAEFLFFNSTLIVRNVGNVRYDKFIEIGIGENYTEVVHMNLSLGESAEYELQAPDGEYDIGVDDGNSNLETTAILTGDTIRVRNTNSYGGFFSGYFFTWILVIFILGLFLFISYKKVVNRRFVLKNKGFSSFKKDKGYVNHPDVREESISIGDSSADNTLVVHGDKQRAVFLSLNVKNKKELDKHKSNAHESIDRAVGEMVNNKAKVYKSGNHIIGVFSPIITKSFDNGVDAVRVGGSMEQILKEHNKKYVHKIEFGIGINEGEVIANNTNKKFSFTPLGNSVQIAKKVSDLAIGEVLLSEDFNTSLKGKLRTSVNNSRSPVKTFSLNDVIDKTEHAKFINKFLDRNYKKLDDFKV